MRTAIFLRRLLCIPVGSFGLFWLGSAIYDLFVWAPWSLAGSLFMMFVSYVVFALVWPPLDNTVGNEVNDKETESQQSAQADKKRIERQRRKKQKRIEKQKNTLTSFQQKDFYELSQKIIEDHEVSLGEARQLKYWFAQYPAAETDKKTRHIFLTLTEALSDHVFDENEKDEILTLLSEFCEIYEQEHQKSAKRFEKQRKPNRNAVVGINQMEQGKLYFMVYEDANGNTTEREIIFKDISRKNSRQYIKTWCRVKQAHRTFRADRVKELFSLDTGEIII